VEYRTWGILTKSLYLSEGVSGAKTVEAFWCEDCVSLKGVEGYRKRRAFLRKLARLFQSLHRQKIYHNDLKASNILVVDEGASSAELFHLIDLQGLRRCSYMSWRRRIKNLAQLNRTLGVFMTTTERLFFLDAYLDFHLPERRKKKRLVESILEQSRRQVERERQRTSVSGETSQTVQIKMDGRCITRAVLLDKTETPR
jgi:tRNA A-37 threonylcarbamoyl transferase component Bud32